MKKPFQLWVDALLSGNYKQIRSKLKTTKGHCCLGVLCEIYNADNDVKIVETVRENVITFFGDDSNFPPEKVLGWLKGTSLKKNEDIIIFLNGLVVSNDCGTPFDQIALRINEYFGGNQNG